MRDELTDTDFERYELDEEEMEGDMEESEDCCIFCGAPIPIEGFCCEKECLEAAHEACSPFSDR